MKVRAKKHLGQHFLKDLSIARSITDALSCEDYNHVIEVGPGMGVLTQYLMTKDLITHVIELDRESVSYLQAEYPQLSQRIYSTDFLKLNLKTITDQPFALIGNFPYNISSQILFKALDYKDQIPEIVGMFQKEVAERILASHNQKIYGRISVITQARCKVKKLLYAPANIFFPKPKVDGVILEFTPMNKYINVNISNLQKIVRQSFEQRRKKIKTSLKDYSHLLRKYKIDDDLRAENLSVDDYCKLASGI